MQNRFTLNPIANRDGWYICKDTTHEIECVFEAHKFNETQQFSVLHPQPLLTSTYYAECARQMGDWLREHYYNIIF